MRSAVSSDESAIMDRLNRYHNEVNLVLWAALLLLVVLFLGH
jgi:hypothetical protein